MDVDVFFSLSLCLSLNLSFSLTMRRGKLHVIRAPAPAPRTRGCSGLLLDRFACLLACVAVLVRFFFMVARSDDHASLPEHDPASQISQLYSVVALQRSGLIKRAIDRS
ncbi:unnamed protein product [Laminaria digitata]